MADGGTDERRSIRDSARSLKRYGSTSSHQKRPEQLIKHVVCKTDTLQGLALRYGVTVSFSEVNVIQWNGCYQFRGQSLDPSY